MAPLTVLVVRERLTKMLLAAVTPRKGPDKKIALRVTNFIEELGCAHLDIITKSDREPAMRSLLREISKMRAEVGGGRTIPEASPAYSSQSNGLVERGVQSVEAQVRVMRSALEDMWKVTLAEHHEIWPSLVE